MTSPSPSTSSSPSTQTGRSPVLTVLAVVVALAAGAAAGGYAVWRHQSSLEHFAQRLGLLESTPASAAHSASEAPQTPAGVKLAQPDADGKPVLYWYDPMKPDVHFDKPGPSPFMDMDLVPKYAPVGAAAAKPKAKVKLAEPDADGKPVLYWYDPMKPDVHFEKSGPSPFMDMDLVPKYASQADLSGGEDENLEPQGVVIDPTLTANLGLKTAKAEAGQLSLSRWFPAEVLVNGHHTAQVQARAEGFVESVAPVTVGDFVKKGQPLAQLTIPSWVEMQSEYLVLVELKRSRAELDAVLLRLKLAGMPDADIEALRRTKKVRTSFHIAAPIDGVLTAFALKNGMNVTKSDAVAAVEGLDPLWVTASVPERYAPYLPQAKFKLSVDAFPGRIWEASAPTVNVTKSDAVAAVEGLDPLWVTASVPERYAPYLPQAKFKLSVDAFPGRIWEASAPTVLPEGEAATRTLKLRFSVDNSNLELRPGMTAKLLLAAPGAQGILVPTQAVIDDGRNPRVIVREGTRFIPKSVRILGESSGQTALASGVQPGEDVVVSGIFLIDSEANIEGALARMQPAADGQSANEGAAAPMAMPADPMKPASPAGVQSEPQSSMPQGMTHGAPDESLETASKPQTVLDLSSPTPSAAKQSQGAAK